MSFDFVARIAKITKVIPRRVDSIAYAWLRKKVNESRFAV